jgi:hypothetical protein
MGHQLVVTDPRPITIYIKVAYQILLEPSSGVIDPVWPLDILLLCTP